MKHILLLAALSSCGTASYEITNNTTQKGGVSWKSVAKININTQLADSYALADTVNVTYVSATVNTITLDTGALVVGSETNDSLALGSVDLTQLVVNDLDQCGVGNTDPCTYARIALYTTDVTGYGGIDGFVNTDDYYGVPILVDGLELGLTDVNAVAAETIDLTGLRRLRDDHFVNGPYVLTVDMSNAGAGNYEANIVIDVQLGN